MRSRGKVESTGNHSAKENKAVLEFKKKSLITKKELDRKLSFKNESVKDRRENESRKGKLTKRRKKKKKMKTVDSCSFYDISKIGSSSNSSRSSYSSSPTRAIPKRPSNRRKYRSFNSHGNRLSTSRISKGYPRLNLNSAQQTQTMTPLSYLAANQNSKIFQTAQYTPAIIPTPFIAGPTQVNYSERPSWTQAVVKNAPVKKIYKRKNKNTKRSGNLLLKKGRRKEDIVFSSSSSLDKSSISKVHSRRQSRKRSIRRGEKRDRKYKETMERIQRLKNLDESLNLKGNSSIFNDRNSSIYNSRGHRGLERKSKNSFNGSSNKLFVVKNSVSKDNQKSRGSLVENFKNSLKKLHEKTKDPLQLKSRYQNEQRDYASTLRLDNKFRSNQSENPQFSERIFNKKLTKFDTFDERPKATNRMASVDNTGGSLPGSKMNTGCSEDFEDYRIMAKVDRSREDSLGEKPAVKMFIDFNKDSEEITQREPVERRRGKRQMIPLPSKGKTKHQLSLAQAFKTRRSVMAERLEQDRTHKMRLAKSRSIMRPAKRSSVQLHRRKRSRISHKEKSVKSQLKKASHSLPKKNHPKPNRAVERLLKGERKKITKREMQEMSKRNYKRLPEVKKKEKETKKLVEFKERQKRVKMFNNVRN